MKTLFLVILLMFPLSVSANELAELPEHLTHPFKQAKSQLTFSSADELKKIFTDKNYSLAGIDSQHQLPQIFTTNLPPDLNRLLVPDKTSLFIRLLLPSVVKVNNDILAVRKELLQLIRKTDKGEKLTQEETSWLKSMAQAYHGSPEELKNLLQKIDILPVDLIMAQAIDESGWGTSHFAIVGNALYGQHLSKTSKGQYISTSDGRVRVASFDNLYHCTASYIYNINTTKAYQKLRDIRAAERMKHQELKGEHLAEALLQYSERGQDYVTTLKWLIKHYKLDQLDSIPFNDSSPFTLVQFAQ